MAASFRCDRPGCTAEIKLAVAASSIVVPEGWLVLVEDGRQTHACSIICFDVLWQQRMWRRGRKMQELGLTEKELQERLR